jgi:hypothetical protein
MGYMFLTLAVVSLVGPVFALFSSGIGLDVQITGPPIVVVGGVVLTVFLFVGANRLLASTRQ